MPLEHEKKNTKEKIEMEITISSFDGKSSWEKTVEGSDILELKNSLSDVIRKMADTFSLKGRLFIETLFTENGEYLDSDINEIVFKENGEFVIEM